jgi:hypothetical protein
VLNYVRFSFQEQLAIHDGCLNAEWSMAHIFAIVKDLLDFEFQYFGLFVSNLH